MGIIESVLTEFELTDGTEYRIEYNQGDVIHVHIDSIRLDFTTEEFLRFAEIVSEGNEQLETDKRA